MKSYLVHTPKSAQRLFPKRVWRGPGQEQTVYLTFDDGPIPEVTPWVLEQLEAYDAKATFFVIGDNVSKHPEIFRSLLDAGHAVGNHTFHHLKQPTVATQQYLEDIEACDRILKEQGHKTQLFRPPYGKLRSKVAKKIATKGKRIVMWDVVSGDFDLQLDPDHCAQNVLKHITPGSIVVFHDSLKAEPRLRHALPKVLEYIREQNWKAESLLGI